MEHPNSNGRTEDSAQERPDDRLTIGIGDAQLHVETSHSCYYYNHLLSSYACWWNISSTRCRFGFSNAGQRMSRAGNRSERGASAAGASAMERLRRQTSVVRGHLRHGNRCGSMNSWFEIREESCSHASNSPCRASAGRTNGPADGEDSESLRELLEASET